MSSKSLITVFAATGAQGGSVIDVVLSQPDLAAKYQLRGVTRDAKSDKSQALISKGVEMVEADLFDRTSVANAVRGSYGVFLNTDYWTLFDKSKETQQGINIVDACTSNNVHHLVLSTLPPVASLSAGKYKGVAHFDSKAEVALYADAHKGNMLISHFLAAMYMENIKPSAREVDGVLHIAFPFPDPHFAWPMITPRRDAGKYVIGLFEGGAAADGVAVQGVSAWTTPTAMAQTLQEHLGKPVQFDSISAETFESFLPDKIREEMSEMMQWIGEASYYGKGTEKLQAESDRWLVKGSKVTSWEEFVKLEF